MNKFGSRQPVARLGQAWRALCAGAVLALAACGGGGEGGTQAGVGSGGTGSFSSGNISAFGSIVVNGTHYDHTRATISVVKADGTSVTLRAADLKLGMTIEVDEAPSTRVNGATQAGALTMRVRSELVGPVSELNEANRTFKVLGQVVHVVDGSGLANTGGTQYEDESGTTYAQPFSELKNGSAMLRNGDVVEVYGHQDVSRNQGEYVATRVERKAANSVPGYVLRGVVKNLNRVDGTCVIGSSPIAYLNTVPLPDDLADGRVARVTLLAQPAVGGTYQGQGVAMTQALQADRANATLAGFVTWVGSGNTRQFELNGIRVDASLGQCSGCVMPQIGQRLRVVGELSGGVLLAGSLSTITELP
jgi:hypothetical protein